MKFNEIIQLLCNKELAHYKDLVQPLYEQYLLYEQERLVLDKYMSVSESLGTPPSLETFISQCPEYVAPAELKTTSDVRDEITLFIKQRKNQQASRRLMEIASKVSVEGITSESVDTINSLMKFINIKQGPIVNNNVECNENIKL